MTRRTALAAVCLSLFIAVPLLPHVSLAQDAAPADTDNAKYQYLGEINAGAVSVRSDPSENSYPTMRVDKGLKVTVVGIKTAWLKVTPPEGSFSYVSKLYVERYGDGTKGRVTKDSLAVWVGSSLTTVKSARQTTLNKGADVVILGEADEYYKIKPPEGAYLWIHQNFVTPVKKLGDENPPEGKSQDTKLAGGDTKPPTTQVADIEPATQPSSTVAADVEAEFDKAEAAFKEAEAKPLEDSPVAELLANYSKLLENDALPVSMRRIAEQRAEYLKSRVDSKEKLVALKKQRKQAEEQLKVLAAERQEIEQRAAKGAVAAYTAVGTLRASSLQLPGQTLYRLTDPANHRTVCYLRTADAKYAAFVGKFVGVTGELIDDAQLSLKVINATDVVEVDPAKINNGVTSRIVPPSLIRPEAETKTDPNP